MQEQILILCVGGFFNFDNVGSLLQECVPVTVPEKRRGSQPRVIKEDESLGKMDAERLRTLRPAFSGSQGSGTVTAGNASPITDGAAALVLMSAGKAAQLGCKVR